MSVVTDKLVGESTNVIVSRDDLVAFVRRLRCDLLENRDAWENSTLDSYLEAMAAWIEDSDGYYRNMGQPVPQTPSWKTLADILLAAKVYE